MNDFLKKHFLFFLSECFSFHASGFFRPRFIDGPTSVAIIVISNPFIHYYLLILLVIIATSHCICIKVSTVQLPGMLLIEKYLPMRYFLLISVYTAE